MAGPASPVAPCGDGHLGAIPLPGRPVSDRPRFANPPVAEVTISVQFEPLAGLHAAHIGRLWDVWAGRYPQHEEHDALAPMPDERQDGARRPALVLTLTDETPLPRTWFLDEAGEHVVQIQRDRFVLNWRRQDEHYPHYAELLPRFREDFETFTSFAADQGLGRVEPNRCQITYLNPIPLEGERSCPDGLRGLLAGWSGAHSEPPTLAGGDASVQVRYPIVVEGAPIGLLFVSAGAAVRADNDQPVLLLELTARGRATGPSLDDIATFLDHGHDAIVTMFAAVTTPEMHAVWGRQP